MARRLPGIQFVAAPPALPEVLPRMDVAAFVGLASSGPLNIPVVVEDPVRFRDIFGDDLTLAYKGAQAHKAFLAGAVRDFFANGGRRCWVVRVADSKAESASFNVPGLYEFVNGGLVAAAFQARSEGAWSDGLQAGATLVQDALGAATIIWEGDAIQLAVSEGARRLLQVGDLLRARFVSETVDRTLFLAITTIAGRLVSGTAVWVDPAASPPVPLKASEMKTLVKDWVQVEAQRLSLSLHALDGSGGAQRLDDLGFHPAHPRYMGALPTDRQLYQGRWREADGERQEVPALWSLADHPRFPFAATGGEVLYLPIGVGSLLDEAALGGASKSAAPAATRNGLSEFSTDYFLDAELSGLTPDGLRIAAAAKAEVRMELPLGLHALWPVREVTMLALPDAVHPGWSEVEWVAPDLLVAPVLTATDSDPPELEWSSVSGATSYEVQIGPDPGLEGAPLRLVAVPTGTQLAPDEVTDLCDTVRYYRVRARRDGEIGPWSNTLRVANPAPTFEPDPLPYLATPTLKLVGGALAWTGPFPASYELQWASDPALDGATTQTVTGKQFLATPAKGPVVYWRVRQVTEEQVSPWSGTILQITPQTAEGLRLANDLAEAADPVYTAAQATTLTLHKEALTLAAARADLVTLLAMPAAAREPVLREHVEQLQAHFGYESFPLSHGSLFAPWLHVTELQDEAPSITLRPPDGAVAGLYAKRTLAGGAWIAAAGRPLERAVSVWPLGLDGGALLAANVNPIQITPQGILPQGQITLVTDGDLEPMNVRRLLILLRRLAIREGNNLVFQPNGPTLWRQVERQFNSLLTSLWQRGAFQGAVSAEGFQLHVGPGAEGQLVVTIQVAPSRPLTFLTVRLVQSLAGGSQVTEGAV